MTTSTTAATGGAGDGTGAGAGADAFLEAREISKFFGSVNALREVSLEIRPGAVTCVLGDNGAGKSTLIKILSGVFPPDGGEFLVDGKAVRFSSPRDARNAGIATVYQDLAMVPLMSVWRNFFLGSEPTKGWGPLRRFDVDTAKALTREGLRSMGIDVRDPDQPVGTLSGGERQCVAIARAVHFGARVLILDEPTSALGVKQAGVVLKHIAKARDMGLGVVFITHNPHHAYPVGDRFVVLNRGRGMGNYAKSEIAREDLVRQMAGGAELEELGHELERFKLEPDGDQAGDGPQEVASPGAAGI
jgi:simple sugar transport system ATP-binding protein